MKNLLGIVILGLLLSGNAYSKVFNWTCLVMPSKDFQLVFEINDTKKTLQKITF